MNDAGLNRRLGKDRFDRLREPLEPIDAADQDVSDAALFELGQDLHPELRALVGLEPQAENFAVSVEVDPHRHITRLALHTAAVADLQHQRVEEHHRVHVIEWPGLPGPGVVHDRVGDLGDQVPADGHTVDLLQVRADVPGRHPSRVQGEDLLIEPLKTPLALSHDLRFKGPVAIPWRVDLDLTVLGDQRLGRRPVPGVPHPARGLSVGLIAEMVRQLDLHRPLDQAFGQLAQQSALAGDLLPGPGAGEQLVDHLVRQQLLDAVLELGLSAGA